MRPSSSCVRRCVCSGVGTDRMIGPLPRTLWFDVGDGPCHLREPGLFDRRSTVECEWTGWLEVCGCDRGCPLWPVLDVGVDGPHDCEWGIIVTVSVLIDSNMFTTQVRFDRGSVRRRPAVWGPGDLELAKARFGELDDVVVSMLDRSRGDFVRVAWWFVGVRRSSGRGGEAKAAMIAAATCQRSRRSLGVDRRGGPAGSSGSRRER